MKKQKNMFQTKGQNKYPEIDLREAEISELPDRELEITVIRSTKLGCLHGSVG